MSSSSNPTDPQNKNQNQNTQQEQPSLVSGHAEYIKGSAEVSPSQTSPYPSQSPFLSSTSSSSSWSTPQPPCSKNHPNSSLAALHQRNRQLRKMKRLRDSRGQHADVMFVANLSSTQSAIGSITGSHAWTTSGEQDKAHARAGLKAAAEGRDAEGKGYGHAEEVVGRWTGCEGMKEEGKASAERERAKRQD